MWINYVRHIIPFSENKDLRSEKTNLITLCQHCHKQSAHDGYWHKTNYYVQKYLQSLITNNKIGDIKMSEIKVGSVVQLNSGGPKMTVSEIDTDNLATCNWMLAGCDAQSVIFPVACIHLYVEN